MEKNGTKILKVLNISSISLDKARFILFSFDKTFRLDSIVGQCMFYEQAYYDGKIFHL